MKKNYIIKRNTKEFVLNYKKVIELSDNSTQNRLLLSDKNNLMLFLCIPKAILLIHGL